MRPYRDELALPKSEVEIDVIGAAVKMAAVIRAHQKKLSLGL